MGVKRVLLLTLGVLSLGAGAVAAVVPLLPSFPFLLLSAFCFARSSPRLSRWFTGTRLYKNNVESYIKGQGLTRGAKIRLMITVTVLMMAGFVLMGQILWGRILLALIWAFHILYFAFGVKTLPQDPG